MTSTTINAWFSHEAATRHGSAVYRKADGTTVNVTRLGEEVREQGPFRHTEKYLGPVVRPEDGGCVRPRWRADGITG